MEPYLFFPKGLKTIELVQYLLKGLLAWEIGAVSKDIYIYVPLLRDSLSPEFL